MSKNETVTLKVKPGDTSGNGWTSTTASNGQPYSFKYSGGENGNGGLKTKVGDGQATIALSVDTDNRYSLFGVNFVQDNSHQLSWQPTAGSQAAGKILVAHEATRACGVGAELSALIAEEAFEDLDAPVRRLTAPDVPIPFSPPLEQAVLPQLDDMKEACRELLAY